MYINPDRIFYEGDKILIRTDDYRYLRIVFFKKDEIGFYTYKAEKTIDMITDPNLKEEAQQKLIELRDEEYRKKVELQCLQDMVLYQSNAKRSCDYKDNKESVDCILCGTWSGEVSGSISKSDDKTEAKIDGKITYETDSGTKFSGSASGSGKIDDKGKTSSQVELKATIEL